MSEVPEPAKTPAVYMTGARIPVEWHGCIDSVKVVTLPCQPPHTILTRGVIIACAAGVEQSTRSLMPTIAACCLDPTERPQPAS